MDNYTIFIASRHFNSIDDYINLEMTTKRFRGNMTKFHYNPISLSSKTIHLFPNVETFHLYSKKDKFLTCGRIFQFVVWYDVGYKEYQKLNQFDKQIKLLKENYPIHWKSITFRPTEAKLFKQTQLFPNEIQKIQISYLNDYWTNIQSISLPHSIQSISNNCFSNCVQLSSIGLSSSLTSIGSKSFYRCFSLRSIDLPTSLSTIGESAFEECTQLSSIHFPEKQLLLGKNCFLNCPLNKEKYHQLIQQDIDNCGIANNHLNQLHQWIGKKSSGIIFNSDYDHWDCLSSSFHSLIYKRSDVLFVIHTKSSGTFGCYIHSIIDSFYPSSISDPLSFLFRIDSNEIKKWNCSFQSKEILKVHDSLTYSNLLTIGQNDIFIRKRFYDSSFNPNGCSFGSSIRKIFNLCKKKQETFSIQQILVIQMK